MARWPNAEFVDGSIWDQEQHWAHGDEDSGSNGVMVDDPHDDVNLASSGIDMTGAIGILNIGSFKTWTRFVNSHGVGNNSFNYDLVPESAYRTKHHYYFLENKLELLDTPREWFFDTATRELYLFAHDGQDPTGHNIRGKVQSYAFTISNSSYVELKGLHFFSTTFKIDYSDYMVVDNCNFIYPSCYKRMLGVVDTEPEMTLLSGSNYSTVSQCAFRYTDGSAIETLSNSDNNTIENCYFYHIDYTVTDLSSVMSTIRMVGSNNVFRQNTLHRTGASSGINPGNLSIVEYNDMYDTGYLQSDGAIVHLMEGQQIGSETRYNWFHDSPKYGARFDGNGDGTLGTMHHNVSWNIKSGHMVKGHHHFVYNNTNFDMDDTENNGIIILIDEDEGDNEGTITRNNAADKIAGHRHDTYQNYPVPGIYDHNWNGYETGGDVRDLLVSPPDYENLEDYSPDQYDFRPNPDSELIDAGLHVEGITEGYIGSAPDLGAYEYEGENWLPGVTWDVSSYQLPVVAVAGDDIIIMSDEDGIATVTLHGSGSSNLGGDALSYIWTLDGTEVSTDVSFNYNLNVGVFTFTLTVSNGVLTASDDVVVTVSEYVENSVLSFIGANEDYYVDCGNDSELQMGTHDLTVEFWFKTAATETTQRIIGNGGSEDLDDGYSIWINNAGKIRAGFSDGTTSDAKNNETIVTDGNWHHCAVIFDRDHKLWVCVDGTCQTKLIDSLSDLNCDNTNDTFVMGRKAETNSTQSYTGSLDEVRIWNTVIDTATVFFWQDQELTSSHPNISNLQAYYKFNESSGTTANDLTADYLGSYESDGTITGAVWEDSDISDFTPYDDVDLQTGTVCGTGDVNNDGDVNVADIVLMVGQILGTVTFDETQLCAADLTVDGLINVVDVIQVIQIILNENLSKGNNPTFIDLSYNNNYISLESDGKVAGLQLEYSGIMDINIKYLPEDWEISYNDHTLLIYSMNGTELIDFKLFDFTGDIELLSAIGLGWNGEEIQAGITLILTKFALHPAYPNPFNPITNIKYSLPLDDKVILEVYNINGKLINTLYSGLKSAGKHSIEWNAESYPSGVYFVKLDAGEFTKTQKLMLVK